MKNCLLSFAVVVALLVGAPAYSQYMFMDVDGDGVNSTASGSGNDALGAASTSIDVWLDLTNDRSGGAIACNDGAGGTFTLISYEFAMKVSGSGSVTFNSFTNNLTGFTTSGVLNDSNPGSVGFDTGAGEAWVFLIATNQANWPAPGKHKLGTVSVTVTGSPKVDFIQYGTANINQNAGTTFGSTCFTGGGLSTWIMGEDWFDQDGTAAQTPVQDTSWGKIKNLYR